MALWNYLVCRILNMLTVSPAVRWEPPLTNPLTKKDGEVPVLELWEMWSAFSLPLLPGPLWLGVVVPVKVPYMSQIDMVSWVWHYTALDGEAPILEIWGVWSTFLLPLLLGPLWLGVVVPVKVQFMS